jgi:methionine-rich copper-binding protein CopC
MFFGEAVRPIAVTVMDSSGVRVDLGDARSETNGRVVRTNLRPLGPGTYRVDWRVQSTDSHVAQGSFTFRVSP